MIDNRFKIDQRKYHLTPLVDDLGNTPKETPKKALKVTREEKEWLELSPVDVAGIWHVAGMGV